VSAPNEHSSRTVGEFAARAAQRLLPAAWFEQGSGSRRGHRYIDVLDFFAVAYGRAPDDAEAAQLRGLVPDGRIRRADQAHRVLMAFDAQFRPTAFAVRATKDSLLKIELNDFSLWLDADDPSVSAVVSDRRDWEPHVAHALADALESGFTFVDVGANVGYHTFLAASIVGPLGSVIAVEASPENCRLLELSKLENRWDQVRILALALDRTPGLRYLTRHLGTNAGFLPERHDSLVEGHGFVVHATTLDDIAPKRVDAIKIDVEGAEFRVLDGGRSVIQRDKPVILMEFSCEMASRVSGVDPWKALDDVLGLGYELFVLDRDTNERTGYASADELLRRWHDPLRIEDLLLSPR
jgi:FkbM family methyltransferase